MMQIDIIAHQQNITINTSRKESKGIKNQIYQKVSYLSRNPLDSVISYHELLF